MKFIGIIPSRYASTRFPGKPLVDIYGKTMIRRVYEQTAKIIDTVVVATDDERIEKEVKKFGGNVIMTSKNHKSGTDRCAEAIDKFQELKNEKFDVIINIQGDEPFIDPEQIKKIISCFDDEETQIATLIKPINNIDDIFNPNKPKVLINKNKQAIYFSRSPIPFVRNFDKNLWIDKHQFYNHIGLYAYKYDVLKEITKLQQSSLEIAESLEQLRWIENDYKIRVEITQNESVSIDTPEDLEKIKDRFK
ncbi:MAG: 3-deoxy-manno-octulosonate cytidylyltransferase [Bacteroidetes bacterium]|nr:3-deoxy-manno-octulosonate cytidylyltransferase [Bacteroidota bacterium]